MGNLQTAEAPISQQVVSQQEDTIDILDILVVLAQNWRKIAIITIAALLVGVFLSLVLRPTYTAEALILPPQQQQSSASALAGQLGALAGLAGGGAASSLGLKNPADMYV